MSEHNKRHATILPSVRALLCERFIFNYRLPLESFPALLPATWLTAQPVHGYGVASFCMLHLRNITVAPLPAIVGLQSISCAPRFAVLDHSQEPAQPAVFVKERHTNSAFQAWFSSLGFPAAHPYTEARIVHEENITLLDSREPGQELLFTAVVKPCDLLESQLFGSVEKFAAFIAAGVASYGPSRHPGQLTQVDLHKTDCTYTPLGVEQIGGSEVAGWQALGGVLDSAFRTEGGLYEWSYHGLTPV